MTQQQLTQWICGAMLAVGVATSTAQTTLYRCGVDGRTFSEKPCTDGGGRTIYVDDSRSVEEREAAGGVARQEAHTADQLARANRQYERSLRPGGAISLSGPGKQEKARQKDRAGTDAADKKARKPKTNKPQTPDDFAAVVPGSEPQKRRRGGSS